MNLFLDFVHTILEIGNRSPHCGHCPLRYHLKKIGKSESECCQYWESVTETAEHLLCKYPAKCFITLSDVRNLAARKRIHFTQSLRIPDLEYIKGYAQNIL